MEPKTKEFELILSAEAVDACSERVREYLTELKLARRDVTRYALSVEEILLKSMDALGQGVAVRLRLGKRFFRPYIEVGVAGVAANVYASDKERHSTLGDSMLKNLGLSPEFSYRDGENLYTFRVRRKSLNPFIRLAITLALAITAGVLGQLVLPAGFRTAVLDGVLTPLHDTFLNVLGCIAGPMVFLSVAWGIYGIGDAATLKRIGKRMLGSYIGTVFLVTLILGCLAVPVFSLHFADGSGGTSELSALFGMLLNIFPKNIFSPFVDGNTLQIIFLAVVIGIAMLFLGQKTTAVARAVEQINYIVQFLIEFISRLVPYFIFIVIVGMIWSDSLTVLSGVGKMFAVFIGMVLLMVIGVLLFASLRNRIRPLRLLRKGLPTLLIALTTASSAAAFGTNMTACRQQYGIDDTIASFGIPLGMVTFKPTTALNYLAVTLFFAESYGVEVSAAWLVVMILTVTVLALATPPIPGGALTAYTVLFAQLGIPVEALAVALACDTIFDFVDTGFDQFLLPFALLNQASRLGMVDREVLKKH